LVKRLPSAAALSLGLVVNVTLASSAFAHVKWFCAFNEAGQPRGLENVLCPDFEVLFGLSILGLMSGCLLEGTSVGSAMIGAIDRATTFLHAHTETMLRAACAFFFISIWAVGGILLTPELKTGSIAVALLQLGIAAGVLSRRTMPLSALGIVALFATAAWRYGAFHLADYPVFVGVAVYLALVGLERDLFGARPVDVLRWSAAVTLMWASVEKWAYPEWSFPLLVEHPGMTLGLEAEFFMRAAGAVEFALAFALIWTPLVRRMAAVLLTGMFVSAVFEFGKIDMIGHALIVAVLLAIAADRGSKAALARYPWLVPVGYAGALGTFIAVYYAAHAAIYGSSLT